MFTLLGTLSNVTGGETDCDANELSGPAAVVLSGNRLVISYWRNISFLYINRTHAQCIFHVIILDHMFRFKMLRLEDNLIHFVVSQSDPVGSHIFYRLLKQRFLNYNSSAWVWFLGFKNSVNWIWSMDFFHLRNNFFCIVINKYFM